MADVSTPIGALPSIAGMPSLRVMLRVFSTRRRRSRPTPPTAAQADGGSRARHPPSQRRRGAPRASHAHRSRRRRVVEKIAPLGAPAIFDVLPKNLFEGLCAAEGCTSPKHHAGRPPGDDTGTARQSLKVSLKHAGPPWHSAPADCSQLAFMLACFPWYLGEIDLCFNLQWGPASSFVILAILYVHPCSNTRVSEWRWEERPCDMVNFGVGAEITTCVEGRLAPLTCVCV